MRKMMIQAVKSIVAACIPLAVCGVNMYGINCILFLGEPKSKIQINEQDIREFNRSIKRR